MKTIEMAYGLALLLTVVLVCCISYGCYRFVETTINSVPHELFIMLGVVCCTSIGLVVSGTSLFIIRWLNYRSRQIFAKNGLYPHIYTGGVYVNLNEEGAQRIAALSHCKPSASTVTKVVESSNILSKNDPAMIPGPAAPAMLTVDEVVSFDPRQTPHVLCAGSTGSGKTSATYQILAQLKNRHRCEFIIAEKGGVNWGAQATATTTDQIAGVIIRANEEMERRQELLRQHDVDHVSVLPQQLPYIVLVLEEMDAVFDELKMVSRDLRTSAIVALRNIARMGRKAGVCMMAISQSGTVDVFDAHVRKNLGNVLLFRSEHTVANNWQVGERLNSLPVGMAYSVGHGGFVQFGKTERPQLVINGSGSLLSGSNAVASVAQVAPVVGPFTQPLPRLSRGCEPDEQLAEQLRKMFESGESITSLCVKLYGYKDGMSYGIIKKILNPDGQ